MSGLEFRIKNVEEGAPLVTTVALTVFVDDIAIWPVHGEDDIGLEIQLDDLLSHLVEFWKPLMLRQTYPLGLNPLRPSDLDYLARRRWADAPEEQAATEGEALERFIERHNLARCFAGYFDLAPLWMIRSGDRFLVEGPVGVNAIAFDSAQDGMVEIGDVIAQRLEATGERWSDLVYAWRARDTGEATPGIPERPPKARIGAA